MKITRKQKVVLLVSVIALALALYAITHAGPTYQGRSLNSWFYEPCEDDAAAFRAMGQDAVSFLIQRLNDAPSGRIKKLLEMLSKPSKEAYRQRKEMWQGRAARLLGEIGPAAQPAVPALTNMAGSASWAVRGSATVALMKIRQEPPDALIEKLHDTSDWRAWYENAIMVGQFGARAEPAIPVLVGALQHSNSIIQAHALIALGMIARQPETCVPAIVPFLSSSSISHRQKAVGALLAFGTNALPAKNSIEAALLDADPWVRRQAEKAMQRLGPLELSTAADQPDGAENRDVPARAETP